MDESNSINELNKPFEDYCTIDNDDQINYLENNLKEKYSEYIGKVIKDWKIENICTLVDGKYLMTLFQCRCIKCGITIREGVNTFLCGPNKCICGYEMKKEWEKIKGAGIYDDEIEYINDKLENINKKYYLINPNENCKKDNLLFGTLSELTNYYNKNKNIKDLISNTKFDKNYEIQCKSCGKIIKKNKTLNICDNCGAVIYREKDFRYDLISCNYFKKQEIDLKIKRGYIPSSISYFNENINIDIYKTMDSILPFYAYIHGQLERLGFSEIEDFNQKRILGKFTFYTNSLGYINFNNVYASFPSDKSNINRPIVLFKQNDTYTLLLDSYKILKNEDLNNIKLILLFKIDKNKFILNMYENNNLILSLENIKNIKSIINYHDILIEFCDNKQYILNADTNELFEYGKSPILKNYHFTDTFTDIDVDVDSDLINNNIKQIILKNLKYKEKYTEYKKVYIKKNYMRSNTVLLQYLKEKKYLTKLDNEFEDDKSENFLALIPWKEKDTIEFIEYVEKMDSSINMRTSYSYNIYGFPLQGVVNSLFSNTKLKMQIIDSLKDNKILKIEDKSKKINIMERILRINDNTSNIEIYNEIKDKLLKKYNANELELLLILISKYGEEIVFGLNINLNMRVEQTPTGAKIMYSIDKNKNKEIFNNILSHLNIEDIKWKSEYMMFQLIKSYFNDSIFQYRCQELGMQSLDVYIPSIRVGFEYQGIQHYEAVDIFGGLEKLKKQKENDERKRIICNNINIKLIEWKYDEPVNKLILDKKLINYKKILQKLYNFTDLGGANE